MFAVTILCDADACLLVGKIREEWTIEQVINVYDLFGVGDDE